MHKTWLHITLFIVIYLIKINLCQYDNGVFPRQKMPSHDACYDADIIIVGAGIAGITFARELTRNGIHDFLILEARNKTGGRFQDVTIGNVSVEIGPNWVHGTNNNPIFDLVKDYGVDGMFENPRSIICRDANGKDVTKAFLKVREKLKNLLKTLGVEYEFMSLRDALRKQGWDNITAIENIAEYSLIDFMDAAPPEVLSGFSPYSQYARPMIDSQNGPQFFITEQNGYKKIIEGLQKEALGIDFTRLKLNSFVTKIKWGQKGVKVETSQGQVYHAKVLLATPSIAVYQKMPTLFEPALPAWKNLAIHKFAMGTYTKIFLKFPYRFWDNLEYIFYASGTRHLFPVWQSLDAGKRFHFDTNILLVTVTWSESYRIEETSKETLMDEIMAHLKLVYGSHVPHPSNIIVPNWASSKFFYGSYSILQKNTTHQDFVALRANVGPIFFAGEATHEVYQGYIHGAYYEGMNRAYDVIQALKGYLNLKTDMLNVDFYDSCLRDSCNCCYH